MHYSLWICLVSFFEIVRASSQLDSALELFRLGQKQQYSCDREQDNCEQSALAHYEMARRYVQSAIKATPQATLTIPFDYIGMLNDLGLLSSRLDSDKAIQVFEEAIELSSDNPSLHILSNYAGMLHQIGNIVEAEAIYRRALDLYPTSGALHYNFGVFLHTNARITDAIAMWNKAVEYSPELSVAWGNLASLACSDGNMTSAKELYARAIGIEQQGVDTLCR